jgi:ABC-2 type transport system ATP-binding protein
MTWPTWERQESMSIVVEVEGLQKAYGPTRAVDDVSFTVEQGEVFGMVGPNGAGKTTTIECVEGLRRPDAGHVRVLGLDPGSDRQALAERIGIQLQQANLPARLRVGEALTLFGSFYQQKSAPRDLVQRLGLSDKWSSPIAKLSGGQRQRMFIALALVNQPELIFLDELTTGLDPQARRSMWDLVREIRQQGRTVFLTTHFMEEAERLCDRVAILDHGRIVALDTPEALVRSLGAESRVVFSVDEGVRDLPLSTLAGVQRVEASGERVIVHGSGDQFISRVVSALEANRIAFRDLRTEQPTLEDVFLSLTGREMRE